jgi:hypothetical protein
MFNKGEPTYLHKYRHSVFPEEFYPIGNGGVQFNFGWHENTPKIMSTYILFH